MKAQEESRTQETPLEPSASGNRQAQREQRSGEDSFLTTVYHGLLEPLQAISGYLELILDGKVPDVEQRKQFLTISYREAQYLTNRFRDLLVASMIEAGELEIHKAPFSVDEFINRCIRQLTNRARIKGVHLHTTPFNLPPVEGDETLLSNVLLDIMDTLIKFAPQEAQVTVSAELKDDQVLIQTNDSGGGTTKEILAQLSQPSRDVNDASAGATAGLGLGLSIARYIVEVHGGRIWFEQAADHGSTFSFTLPLEAKIEKVERARSAIPRILIVEDEPAPLEMMEYTLQHEGFETFKASNGIEALEIVKRERVDLIILDVMLPGMDGYEVCHRLRSTPETADIPVLMISAKAKEEDKATALRVGAQAYFKKPFGMSDLVSGVRKLLADAEHDHRRDRDGIPIIT